MNTYTTKTGAKLKLSEAVAQKIEAATINDALLWNEAHDKAVFIADFLGFFSIEQLLNNPDLEDQVEERFNKLIANAVKVQLTGSQKDVIKSFDSRTSVIKRQVELAFLWERERLAEQRLKLIEELAGINLYLNLRAL